MLKLFLIYTRLKDTYVRKLAVSFIKVKTVSYNELILDNESRIVGLKFNDTSFGFPIGVSFFVRQSIFQ